MTKDCYSLLGASASKQGLHQALEACGLPGTSGHFCQLLPDFAGDTDFNSFVHCDGAGTKSIIAYIIYKETGDISAFSGLSQDATVMNLDDVFCIGTPDNMALANFINRNARLINDEILNQILLGYQNIISLMSNYGVNILAAGGETADTGDTVRTLLIDAVLSGRIRKANVIKAEEIQAGDIILGFSSLGQLSYEDKPNSGIGSNGLTLARHALLDANYLSNYPEIVDQSNLSGNKIRGRFKIQEQSEELGMSIGEALSSPTRTYAPVLKEVYKNLHQHIHAAIHLTGGAHTKVLRFGKGLHFVKDQPFAFPPLFSLIQQEANVAWKEMYQVFNMGNRFELYLPEKYVKQVEQIAKNYNLDTKVIGYVEKNPTSDKQNQLTICLKDGDLKYTL